MILKKILSFQTFVLLLCLIVSSFMFTSFVYAETSGDYVYTINGDDTATITDYTGTDVTVIFPDTLDGHTVTSICATENGGMGTPTMETIIIPGTVKEIGCGSFYGVTNLTSITLNEGLETITNGSFVNTGLTSITIPDSVGIITNSAFAGISTLTNVDFGEGIQEISGSAFSGTGLTNITIPDSVRTITNAAFSGVSTLTSVDLGEGVEIINNSAFWGTDIKNLVIPNSVTVLGAGSLPYSLESLEIGGGIKVLGSLFSNGFSKLTNIVLNEGLETIENGTFSSTKISSIKIPDSVKIIRNNAFSGITTLTSIDFGYGLEEISGAPFSGTSLTEIVIPNTVNTILTNGAFSGISTLENVDLGDGVKTITNGAFAGISTLVEVDLGEGVETINNGAFYETGITSIVIPVSVQILGAGTFSNFLLDIYFKGNAPANIDQGVFNGEATVYYYEGKTGFDDSWNIYNTVILPKPTIITTLASNITSNSSTLNANITSSDNEMNRTTVIGFEYGLTIEYGNNIEEEGESYPTGTFSQNLTSLTCNTTYHYRAYATNSAGTSYGEDITFTTSACDVVDDDNDTKRHSRVIGSINPSTLLGKKSEDIVNTNPEIKNPITTPSFSMIYTRLLKQGTRGDDIKQIQTYLTSKGYILGLPDGIFGPKTKQAVINFQKANGLTPDGLIGKLTIAKMNELK